MVFDCFIQWLYYGPEQIFSSLSSDDCFMRLAQLQLFSDTFTVRSLHNDIIWELFHLRSKKDIPPMSVIDFAFSNLANFSTFRALLVDWYIWPPRTRRDDEVPTLEELEKVPRFACECTFRQARQADRDPFLSGPTEHYVKVEDDVVEDTTNLRDDEWADSRGEGDSEKSNESAKE